MHVNLKRGESVEADGTLLGAYLQFSVLQEKFHFLSRAEEATELYFIGRKLNIRIRTNDRRVPP